MSEAAPLVDAVATAQAAGVPTWILAASALPFAVVLLTSFTRISIVLAFLRHGLGTPDVPSATVATVLAALLSGVAMAPVLARVQREAYRPLRAEEISTEQALERAWVPLRAFLEAQTRPHDRALFARLLAERAVLADEADSAVLIPAFVVSELKSGFQIGLVIWVPFLAVDLLVAMLLSVSGLALEARLAALPLKLLLFVAVDGWALLAAGLVRSFAGAA